MFHFVGWLLGFAPWGKWSECDRSIEFDYVSFSGRRAHHPIYVHWLVERIIGPTMIKGVYPGGGDHEYAFLISRMQRIRDMETNRLVKPHRFTEWLKGS